MQFKDEAFINKSFPTFWQSALSKENHGSTKKKLINKRKKGWNDVDLTVVIGSRVTKWCYLFASVAKLISTMFTSVLQLYSHPRRPRDSQSEAGEMARRKFSRTGGRTPGYQVSPDHFQTASRIPDPDWAEKIPCIILPNRRAATLESLSCVLTRRLLSCHTCLVRSPRLCVRGKLSFWLSLPEMKGLMRLGKSLQLLAAKPFQFPPRKFFFWPITRCRK